MKSILSQIVKLIRKTGLYALIPILMIAVSLTTFAHTQQQVLATKASKVSLKAWLSSASDLASERLLKNISPSDALPGAVVAALTRYQPNYYFHWVRDAGIVMVAVVERYRQSYDPIERQILKRKLTEYLSFSETIQAAPSLTGLGEPKYNVDGTAYNGPWGRPQNDSPALRAISFIHWAKVLMAEGDAKLVHRLYDGTLPPRSVIKRDLEYVARHWRDASFDLWEEVKGDHFYTRMVQRRALLEGADLADALGDHGAAQWYRRQGHEIERTIQDFWSAKQGYYRATLNRVEGLEYKNRELDVAVVLGLIHGSLDDGFIPFSDQKVLSTIDHIVEAFANLYPINQRDGLPGTAIGRYPEDRYGGDNFNGGNPWPLCTLAIAEAYYRASSELRARGQGDEADRLMRRADQFVERVRYHGHSDGSLNEQIDRNSGYMTSVSDLTWNYAALLTSGWAREQAMKVK